jgi:hypothetical protein
MVHLQELLHEEIFCKTVNKEMDIDMVCRLRVVVKENATKNGEQQLVSPSRQCSNTPVGFGRGFINKEQRDNTGASPILS